MKYELKESRLYRVKHKDYRNKPSNKVKRYFLYTEKRFGNILCYVFSAVIQKDRFGVVGHSVMQYSSVISIPEYDLVSVEAA